MIGTPEPLAFVDKKERGRLAESLYLSKFEPALISFKDALIGLLHEDLSCERLMCLLETIAVAVADMHDAGFIHNDLGNQNIFLRKAGYDSDEEVLFLDLNRGRIVKKPSLRERARDISRIYLPSDLLRVFKEMYFRGTRPPPSFQRWEAFFRKKYALHTVTRCIRHPLRARIAAPAEGPDYPSEKDMWIWDERSAQPINVMQPRDRRRHLSLRKTLIPIVAASVRVTSVWRESIKLLDTAFASRVNMNNRVGVALSPSLSTIDRQLEMIEGWGKIPVLVRIMHHEGEGRWSECVEIVRSLKKMGYPVTVALVQDRMALRKPALWDAFATEIVKQIADFVEQIEVGHAINRVKWGIWDFDEYQRLLHPFVELARSYPGIAFIGPAGIDYEYLFVMAALSRVPHGFRFKAFSHHLYVDRRGAPENPQWTFSLLEKCAQARAIARVSGVCDDHLIITETGWPLKGTGVYSPVTSPYESPGPRLDDPSVSEDVYADYMLRYVAIALASGIAEKVFWWRLVARGFGLIDDTDMINWRPRPAFYAMFQFLKLVGRGSFVGKSSAQESGDEVRTGGHDGIYCLRFVSSNGEPWAMCWSAKGRREVRMRREVQEVQDIFAQPIQFRSTQNLTLDARPIYVRFGEM